MGREVDPQIGVDPIVIGPVIGLAQGAVGLGIKAEEDAGIHGKGKTIVPGGIAQEKRDVEVGEIAGQEAA